MYTFHGEANTRETQEPSCPEKQKRTITKTDVDDAISKFPTKKSKTGEEKRRRHKIPIIPFSNLRPHNLLPTLQIPMLSLDTPSNGIKRQPSTLGRKHHTATHIKKGKIASNQMMLHSCCLVEHVDLTRDDVFAFFTSVEQRVGFSRGDFVET
jgi:hypothetical protein